MRLNTAPQRVQQIEAMWPCADGVSEDIFEDVWDYKICFLIINKIYFIYIIRYVWKIKGRDL